MHDEGGLIYIYYEKYLTLIVHLDEGRSSSNYCTRRRRRRRREEARVLHLFAYAVCRLLDRLTDPVIITGLGPLYYLPRSNNVAATYGKSVMP